MNRVLQAAGRCIRSETDKGAIILMDERFKWKNYSKCFPFDMDFIVFLRSRRVSAQVLYQAFLASYLFHPISFPNLLKMTLVKDVMSRQILTVSDKETASDAADLLKERGVSALIVLRGRNPLGIITERDLVFRVLCEKKDPEKTLVGSVMSTPLLAITPVASIEDAADAFRRGKVKKLAVISGGVLEGIVSVTDILAAETREIKAVSRYVELLSK